MDEWSELRQNAWRAVLDLLEHAHALRMQIEEEKGINGTSAHNARDHVRILVDISDALEGLRHPLR